MATVEPSDKYRPRQTEVSLTGRGLLLLSDHWTLLILLRIFAKEHRYQQIRDSIQVSDSILSARLKTLTANGVLVMQPYKDGRVRYEYHLTDSGKQTWRIFVAAYVWQTRWLDSAPGLNGSLMHTACGHATDPVLVCAKCGGQVTPNDTSVTQHGDGLNYVGIGLRRHPQSRTLHMARENALRLNMETMELLGNRWNTGIASAAIIGLRRFSEFERYLEIPPAVLSSRLSRFVELGILRVQDLAGGTGRTDYRLTPKGRAMSGFLLEMVYWSNNSLHTGEKKTFEIFHNACGRKLKPEFDCSHCGERLRRRDLWLDHHGS